MLKSIIGKFWSIIDTGLISTSDETNVGESTGRFIILGEEEFGKLSIVCQICQKFSHSKFFVYN